MLKCYAIQSKEGDSTEAYADKYKFKRLEHGSSMDVQQKEHKERWQWQTAWVTDVEQMREILKKSHLIQNFS